MIIMPPSGILQTLIDSKKEYTNHLCDLITPFLVKEFFGIYDECKVGPNPRNILQRFQENISKIAEWNTEQIHQSFIKFAEKSKCTYLGNLVKELVLTSVKIHLINHNIPLSDFKVQIRVPGAESFYHRVLVNSARAIWKQPYIFYHQVRTVERQSNLIAIEKLVRENIVTTLRACVPMEEMMRLTAIAEPAAPVREPQRRRQVRRPRESSSVDESSSYSGSSSEEESGSDSGDSSGSEEESGSDSDSGGSEEESGSDSDSGGSGSEEESGSNSDSDGSEEESGSDSDSGEESGSGSNTEQPVAPLAAPIEAPLEPEPEAKIVTIEPQHSELSRLSQKKRPVADGTFF